MKKKDYIANELLKSKFDKSVLEEEIKEQSIENEAISNLLNSAISPNLLIAQITKRGGTGTNYMIAIENESDIERIKDIMIDENGQSLGYGIDMINCFSKENSEKTGDINTVLTKFYIDDNINNDGYILNTRIVTECVDIGNSYNFRNISLLDTTGYQVDSNLTKYLNNSDNYYILGLSNRHKI